MGKFLNSEMIPIKTRENKIEISLTCLVFNFRPLKKIAIIMKTKKFIIVMKKRRNYRKTFSICSPLICPLFSTIAMSTNKISTWTENLMVSKFQLINTSKK
jgi:hypothetical protein